MSPCAILHLTFYSSSSYLPCKGPFCARSSTFANVRSVLRISQGKARIIQCSSLLMAPMLHFIYELEEWQDGFLSEQLKGIFSVDLVGVWFVVRVCV